MSKKREGSSTRIKALSQNTIILAIGNFSSRALSFFLVPLYTGVLSTLEVGDYDLVITTIQLLAPVITVNIADGVMRFLFDKSKEKKEVASVGFYYLVGSCIVFSFLLLASYIFQWPVFMLDNLPYILLYYIGFVFQAYMCQLAKGMERVLDICIAGVLGTVVSLTLNIICLVVLKLGVTGFFIANAMGNIVQIVYYFLRLKYWRMIISVHSISKGLRREMILYSAPLILSSLAWAINNSLDKYMVTYFYGEEFEGLLSVAYKIPTILNVCSMFFIQAWQISAISEYESEDSKCFYSNVFSMFNSIVVIICSGLILFTRIIAKILFLKDFYSAWEYVPFLLLSMCFSVTATFIGPLLSANKDSKGMARSALAGAITNAVMNYLLILWLGVVGATIATALSSLVIFIMRRWFARKMLDDSIVNKGIISWIVISIQAVSEVYLHSYYIGGVCLAIVLGINFKNLIKAVKKVLK